MKADKYYGEAARKYDAERCHTLRWAKEQVAVADLVSEGPVLDVPLGTGRYVDIYRELGLGVVGLDISPDMLEQARAKYPNLDARQGSVFELPFPDQSFGTVVCTRLLDWLTPEEMRRAVSELRRVAYSLVVSIRHGAEEIKINQTHDLVKFFEATEGLHIVERRVTEVSSHGLEEIMLLRPPMWEDVLDQFRWHGITPAWEAERLARYWCKDARLYREDNRQPKHVEVITECWPVSRLGEIIDEMAAEHDHDQPKELCYSTNDPPRFDPEAPPTLFNGFGRTIVLDGRRRINQWRRSKGPWKRPVLLLKHRDYWSRQERRRKRVGAKD